MEQKLKRIMSTLFDVKEDEIRDESSIENIDEWDSLKHINLILAIEEEFGISTDEDQMAEMISFAKIMHVLTDKGVR
ncbi:acyl carrier protein [candidate division KSB1 bacterium]|nr:acyl carrier protein [candidate division KSB1 bacterium]